RVEAVDAFDDHVATAPAVAAVRSAELDELLAPKADAAGAAVAGADVDVGLVEEFHDRGSANEKGEQRTVPPSLILLDGNGYSAANAGAGVTFTSTLPPERVRKVTTPSA